MNWPDLIAGVQPVSYPAGMMPRKPCILRERGRDPGGDAGLCPVGIPYQL